MLKMAVDIAESHHEYWDGSGYPLGKKGEDIPLAARIVALADTYDSMTSRRCYKSASSHDDTKQYILQKTRKQFDPDLVDAFIALEREFIQIRTTLVDPEVATGATQTQKITG